MTDARLQSLVDRQQISDLLSRYCIALDRMELGELASLFTQDCSVAYGPDVPLRSEGADALARSLERMWRWSRTSHHLSNVLIEFENEDSANVLSNVMAWHERPDGTTATVYGQYQDLILRVDDEWRIAKRRMVMNGNDAGFTVNLFPARRNPPPAGWSPPELSS